MIVNKDPEGMDVGITKLLATLHQISSGSPNKVG
jgi:hypothetical protein